LILAGRRGHCSDFDLRKLTWKTVPFLRRTIGVVFQDFQLLTDRNVNDNLKFVLKAIGWKDEKLMPKKLPMCWIKWG
jgi:cell division transport system ATP-binding protein